MRTVAAAGVGAGLFGALGVLDGADAVEWVRLAILGAALGAVAVYDARERRIPNRIVLPAAGACGVLALMAGAEPGLWVGLALVAALLLLSLLRPGSLGMGDVKLALLIVLGLNGDVLPALALGFALAALAGLLLLARNGRTAWRTSLPLAPFLAAGTLGALLVAALG